MSATTAHPAIGFISREMEDALNTGWIDVGLPNAEPVTDTAAPAQVFARARKD